MFIVANIKKNIAKGEIKLYESTRGNLRGQSASQAIAWGMVPGGGLFVPEEIPQFSWQKARGLTYSELAQKVMALYLPDFSETVIARASSVYKKGIFANENPAPLQEVGDYSVLELWHGPTAAFKDMALQVLPHLLGASLKNLNNRSEVLILVATSGDTGKAALEGFKNVEGTQIVVFYPDGGVSAVQERQMTTTNGQNTHVVAVNGNFDECQSAVKEIFASAELRTLMTQKDKLFSSANSINWGRLLPQIVYYIWAYLQAVENGKIQAGAPLNVAVPTGNFGNILAAYYAKRMGLPIGRLICASNKNNVLTDFFAAGTYQSRRPFYLTISPSMDILISSNFERFLYEMAKRDAEKITDWYQDLAHTGSFSVDSATLTESLENMYAGWADEAQVLNTIKKSQEQLGYVFDPHTAVAVKVYEDYVKTTGDDTHTVIVSTASPFKFAGSVLQGITGQNGISNEWEALNELERMSGWEVPRGLRGLQDLKAQPVRKCSPSQIAKLVQDEFVR